MALVEASHYPTLSCMLLPMSSNDVLVPKSIVRDVVYKPTLNTYEDHSDDDWLVGDIEWQDYIIPVVSFERLCNQARVSKKQHIRVAICHVIDHADSFPLYAIEVQSIPRPLILDRRALCNHEGLMSQGTELIAYDVKIGSKELIIPNFQKLEEILLTHAR